MNNYKNMSDEEIKEQLEWSDHHEFSYGYSIWAFEELKQLKKQKDDVVELCNKSIKSINDRLAWVDTKKSYPNEYQRVRLKAFRTKCKEILRMLGECNE